MNQGFTNDTGLSFRVSDPRSPESVIESLSLVFTCLSGIVGNGCVVAAIIRSERLRERPGTLLVCSLAITDGVFMPIAIAFKIAFLNYFSVVSKSACDVLAFFLVIVIYIAILHLLLMSCDRFVAVVYPLRSRTILTQRRVLYLLVPAWFLPVGSIGIIPHILKTHEQGMTFRGSLLSCVTTFKPESSQSSKAHQLHLLANTLFFVVIPFVTMLVLYSKLGVISFKQENKVSTAIVAPQSANERRFKAKKIKEMKWTKTVGIVIGVFAVTYIPSFTCALVEVKFGPGVIPHKLFTFFAAVVFLNSPINAVIYSFRSEEYRREFKKIIRDLLRKFHPGFGTEGSRRFEIRDLPRVAPSSLVLEARIQATETTSTVRVDCTSEI